MILRRQIGMSGGLNSFKIFYLDMLFNMWMLMSTQGDGQIETIRNKNVNTVIIKAQVYSNMWMGSLANFFLSRLYRS
jgi:protein gp37